MLNLDHARRALILHDGLGEESQVYLTIKEFQLLELLNSKADTGKTVSKKMILDHLYGGVNEPAQKIIDVFVCKLRRKLPPGTIKTVWGRGYLLASTSESSPKKWIVRRKADVIAAVHAGRLPPPTQERWTPKRKVEIVNGISEGLISVEEAANRYRLSSSELLSWCEALTQNGLPGLRTTRIQQYPR